MTGRDEEPHPQRGPGSLGAGSGDGLLIVRRPRGDGAGALRRFRLELDATPIESLRYGGTALLSLAPGHHVLTARCWPMTSGALALEIVSGQTIEVIAQLGMLSHLGSAADLS